MKWYLAMLFDGRTVGFGVAYSILFALSCFLGAFVYDNAESGFAIILATAAFLIALILFFGAVKLLDRLDERVSINNRGTVVPAQKKRSAVATFAAIWVIWLFWYALYYPGCTSTDSMDVLKMTLGFPFEEDHFRYDTLNSHHPLLYVGFVALFGRIGVLLGGIGGAIAVTSFVQMTIFAACAAYVVWWVRDRTRSRVAWIAAFLFFAINPLIGRYAVTLWKDVLFSAALTIFCLKCFDLFESRGGLLKKRSFCIGFATSLAFVSLLRSNGFIVAGLSVVVLAIVCRDTRKLVVAWGFGALLAVYLVQSAVAGASGVVPAHFAESVSVPLQQIGKTIATDGVVTDEQAEFIGQIIPLDSIREAYHSDTANWIKFHEQFDDDYLDSHKIEFIAVWMSMFPANAITYISAWLEETVGYWYVDLGGWTVADSGYTLELEGEATTVAASPLVPEAIASSWLFHDTQPTDLLAKLFPPLCRGACLVWFLLFVLSVQISRKRYIAVVTLLPLAIYWATFLVAAPIFCEFRYMFPLHFAIPLIVYCLLLPSRFSKTP